MSEYLIDNGLSRINTLNDSKFTYIVTPVYKTIDSDNVLIIIKLKFNNFKLTNEYGEVYDRTFLFLNTKISYGELVLSSNDFSKVVHNRYRVDGYEIDFPLIQNLINLSDLRENIIYNQ